jgi:hypothetical protein
LPVYRPADLESANRGLSPDAEFDAEREKDLEGRSEIIVGHWQAAARSVIETQKLFKNQTQLKESIKTLRRADRIIRQINPWFKDDPRVRSIMVQVEDPAPNALERFRGPETYFVCPPKDKLASMAAADQEKGILEIAADWLSEIKPPQGGRQIKLVIALCANELAALYQKHGKPNWKRVGEILERAFNEPRHSNPGR